MAIHPLLGSELPAQAKETIWGERVDDCHAVRHLGGTLRRQCADDDLRRATERSSEERQDLVTAQELLRNTRRELEEGLNDHGFQKNVIVRCMYTSTALETFDEHWNDDIVFAASSDPADDREQVIR